MFLQKGNFILPFAINVMLNLILLLFVSPDLFRQFSAVSCPQGGGESVLSFLLTIRSLRGLRSEVDEVERVASTVVGLFST